MVAKEFSIQLEQDNMDLKYFDEEEDETLSLCDLAVDSSAAEYWNDFNKEDQSSSSDQDFFEFFNKDFTASPHPRDNIIFCGKLISHKELSVPEINQFTKIPTKQKNPKSRGSSFKWKSQSLDGARVLPSPTWWPKKSHERSISMPASSSFAKYDKKFDYSVKKVSILATPMKSRWYLFAFGVGRFPKEMELRDIKTRQRKKGPATMFQLKADAEIVNSRRTGFWGLIRSIICRKQPAGAAVKTSFGCIPVV